MSEPEEDITVVFPLEVGWTFEDPEWEKVKRMSDEVLRGYALTMLAAEHGFSSMFASKHVAPEIVRDGVRTIWAWGVEDLEDSERLYTREDLAKYAAEESWRDNLRSDTDMTKEQLDAIRFVWKPIARLDLASPTWHVEPDETHQVMWVENMPETEHYGDGATSYYVRTEELLERT